MLSLPSSVVVSESKEDKTSLLEVELTTSRARPTNEDKDRFMKWTGSDRRALLIDFNTILKQTWHQLFFLKCLCVCLLNTKCSLIIFNGWTQSCNEWVTWVRCREHIDHLKHKFLYKTFSDIDLLSLPLEILYSIFESFKTEQLLEICISRDTYASKTRYQVLLGLLYDQEATNMGSNMIRNRMLFESWTFTLYFFLFMFTFKTDGSDHNIYSTCTSKSNVKAMVRWDGVGMTFFVQ